MNKQNSSPVRFRRKPLITALEPRILLDGAAVATTAEMTTDVAFQDEAVHSESAEQSVHFAAPAPTSSDNGNRREVAFVDKGVEDYQALVEGFGDDVEVFLLEADQNGLEQMLATLQGESGIDAIHLYSHGDVGTLQLGTVTLDESNLSDNAQLLAELGQSLSEDGDLMLYGCSVGADSEGQAFIDQIAELTDADVAASTDLTGAHEQGGDWELEASAGAIETASQAIDGYSHILTIAGWSDQTYTEQQGEISLGNGITLSNGDNYGTGYVRFEVTGGKQVEDILRLNSSNSPTVEDQVSVQGSTVYIGQGAGNALLKIGTIDSFHNGQGGRALQINFDNATIPGTNPVTNGDFSRPFNEGWNAYTSHVNLGSTTITFSNGKTWVIPEPGSQYYPSQTPGRDDNDLHPSSTSYGTYDNGIVQISGNRLRLEETSLTTTGYGVVHGPAAYSDSFAASAGMVLQFDWEANNINDDYHVVAYLMNVDTGAAQLVFADWGTRGAGTEFVSVPADGNYSFVFVSGTFDKTGGTAAGASMYIDNIRVEEAAVTDEVLSNLALQVMYQNTSDNPTTSKTVTLSTRNINGVTESDTMALTVTPVNDPSSLAGNAQLPTILEDQAINDGRTVSQLFGSLFSDVDNGDTLGGVFITSNPLAGDATDGVWEYQVAGSSTWHDIGTVSESDALLLAADTRIRFNPAADYNGTPDALSLKGVDQTRAGQGAGTTDGSRVTYDTTQATPEDGLSSQTRTLSISVTSVNDIPVFDSTENSTSLTETSNVDAVIGDLTVQPGDVLTGQLQVSDIETDAALLALVIRGGTETASGSGIWELSGRYGTLVLDTTDNNTWTYTPDKWDAINALRDGQVVTDTFQFKVSDGDGGVALQDFTITLNGVNDTPLEVNPLQGQNFTGDGAWTWQVPANTFTDAEGTGLTYSAWVTEVDGVPVTPYEVTDVNTADGSATDWLTFDAVSRTLSGDPSATWADKDLTIEIRANDGAAQATSAFTLALTDTANNQAPVVVNEMNWASIDAQAAPWTLQVPVDTFADTDSPDGLSYSAFIIDPVTGVATAIDGSQAPDLVFDANTGQLSGSGAIQDRIIRIVATDDKQPGYSQASASTEFQLTVYNSVDSTPAVTATPNASGVTGLLIDGAGEGSYTLPANAFDIEAPANSTVTYAAEPTGGGSLPSWLIFDTATGTFSGNPPDGTADLDIVVTATVDDGVSPVTSGPLALTLQVANPNDPIVLATAPLDDQTITAGTQLGLTFAAPFSDPDGVLTGYETNTGVPRVDGIDYEAVIVDENGVETPASDFGLTLAQDGTGNLTLNGNPPGGYAYLNIVIKGTEVDGGSTKATSFTLYLNDASASDDQDVAAYSANDAGVVTVTGTATQGHTLTASTADDNGLTGTPSYQWQVSSDNGVTWQDIARPESQAATLQLTQAEAGKQVRVQSFYTDDSGVFESPVSDAIAVADVDDAGVISISGPQTVGGILSSTLTDADGLTEADPQYQWQVSTNGGSTWTNISGATYSTYQVTANEGGHQVRVQASYTDDMGNNETVTSEGKAIQLGAVAPVAVNDTNEITEAGGVDNSTPSTAPVSGNVLTNDSDQNSGDTLTIATLRTGNLEGFGVEATHSGSFTLSGSYGQIVMDESGNYTYTLDETNAAVQALAAGDTLTEYFNYSVKDSTDLFDQAVLSITIRGSNDAPVVDTPTADETDEAADGSAQDILVTGSLRFDDVDTDDLIDVLSSSNDDMVWSDGTLPSGLASALWAGLSLSGTDLNAPGSLDWTFSVSGVDLDFLSVNETITFSYDVTVTDALGATDTTTLNFVINGTNDAPTIQVTQASDFTEDGDASAQSLTQSGTVTFDDADTNDRIAISSNVKDDVVWSHGTLSSSLVTQLKDGLSVTGTGLNAPGSVGWNYDVSAVSLDFLAEGETITFSYDIVATDLTGTATSQTLLFTIRGTNDLPEIQVTKASDFVESGDASAQSLSQSGSVFFNDVDTNDRLRIDSSSNRDMSWSGGTLDAGLSNRLWSGLAVKGTGLAGQGSVAWNYNVSAADLDFLAAGETIRFSYRITVTDSSGGASSDTLTFTIHGTNDAPVVNVSSAADFIEATDAENQLLAQTGTVTFSDADKNNVLINVNYDANNDIVWVRNDGSEVAELPAGLAAQLTSAFSTGVKGAANNGQIAWEFDAGTLDLDFLNEGDRITFSYTVTATDERGASHSDQLTFTIVGTNDTPEVTFVELTREETTVQMGEEYQLDISVLFDDKDSTLSREQTSLEIQGLPDGLVYDSVTGIISGAAQQSGIFNIILTATDAEGAFVQRTFELTVTAVITDDGNTNDKGDSSEPPAPENDTQSIDTGFTSMPTGLVSNGGSSDPTGDSGFMKGNTEGFVAGGTGTGEAEGTAGDNGAPQQEQPSGDTGEERVVLSEAGALVTETRTADGRINLKASVDVVVTDSGEVIFSDAQKEAFGVVSLAVASISQTADAEIVIDIEDTSPNAASQVYSGTLGDGTRLPDWISLDPATGTVTINNAPVGQKEVIIRVQAIGADGQVRVLELKLDLEELLKKLKETQPDVEPEVSFVPLSEQLETELVARDQYGARLMALLQSV